MAIQTRGTSAPGPHRGTPATGPALADALNADLLTIDIRLFAEDDAADFFGAADADAPHASQATQAQPDPAPAGTSDAGEADAGDDAGQDDPPDDSGDEAPAAPQKVFGRYDSLEAAEQGYKSLQTQYQQQNELIKRLGGPEALQRLLESQQAQPQAAAVQPQAAPAQGQNVIPQDGQTVDTPWGVLSREDALTRYWEMGPEAYTDAVTTYKADKAVRQATAPLRQQQNTAAVVQKLGEKYDDFQTFVPQIVASVQGTPDEARLASLAADDPARFEAEVERLYLQAYRQTAKKAVAEAGKAGEQRAKLRADQQRAATVGAQAARTATQTPPQDDWAAEFLGPPRIE
ncbi:MAG TPA: hypothetical protein VFK80_06090 [Limnochordia bacterium]|nr:hypothetical protein [Limnochordia bacterium]